MSNEPSIYQQVIDAGIPHSNHSSDLYIPVNDVTRKLIAGYKFKTNVTTFTNRVEGGRWYDIPFAYEPEWNRRLGKGNTKDAPSYVK